MSVAQYLTALLAMGLMAALAALIAVMVITWLGRRR